MVKKSPDATQNCSQIKKKIQFSLRSSAFTVEKESEGKAAHTNTKKGVEFK